MIIVVPTLLRIFGNFRVICLGVAIQESSKTKWKQIDWIWAPTDWVPRGTTAHQRGFTGVEYLNGRFEIARLGCDNPPFPSNFPPRRSKSHRFGALSHWFDQIFHCFGASSHQFTALSHRFGRISTVSVRYRTHSLRHRTDLFEFPPIWCVIASNHCVVAPFWWNRASHGWRIVPKTWNKEQTDMQFHTFQNDFQEIDRLNLKIG